jgi:hypothetical protein
MKPLAYPNIMLGVLYSSNLKKIKLLFIFLRKKKNVIHIFKEKNEANDQSVHLWLFKYQAIVWKNIPSQKQKLHYSNMILIATDYYDGLKHDTDRQRSLETSAPIFIVNGLKVSNSPFFHTEKI